MSLLDTTYFVRDINIPTGTYNTLEESIARYERDFLIQVLGYDLAALVLAYNVSTSPQRIKDIVNGKEYTESDYTVKWNGLTNTELVSPLAYFVYIKHLRDHYETAQNIGMIINDSESGQVVSAGALIQRASGRMRQLVGYPGNDMYAPSLYNFLMKYASTYPEWLFVDLGFENTFDL